MALLSGCDGGSTEDDDLTQDAKPTDTVPRCTPDTVNACTCDAGLESQRICDETTGEWGECLCESADAQPEGINSGAIITEPDDESAFLWDGDVLRTFELLIKEEDLAILDADPRAEVYVPGTLVFEGQQYGPVGVRYKGSYGAYMSPCTSVTRESMDFSKTGKCCLKVSFNWNNPEGRFFGLKKLQFHSMIHDPSFLRERLAYSLFREMGIPASRVVHARVIINGKFEGLFALVEQIDGRFTRSRFVEGGKGNLYKEVWPMHESEDIYLAALKTNEDESPSVKAMLDFKAAIEEGPESMKAWIDKELMLRYLAVDRVIINDDGIMHWWCMGRGGIGGNPGPYANHNYYWYMASDESQIWLIPWDLDACMKPDNMVQVYSEWWQKTEECSCQPNPQSYYTGPQFPPSCDPLIGEWGEWLTDFEQVRDAFIAGPFATAKVEATLDTWAAQIKDSVIEQYNAKIPTWDEGDQLLSLEEWREEIATLKSLLRDMVANGGYAY